MPYVVSQKQKIHYLTEGERGAFIFMHPPFPESAESFRRQGYVKELEERFRLVIIDPLGQGKSDRPLDPECYTLASRMEHVMDVAQELMLDHFHFLGIELGGQVGYLLALHHPRHVRTLTVVGAHPYPVTTDLPQLNQWVEELRESGVSPQIERIESQTGMSPDRKSDWTHCEPEALALALEANGRWAGIGNDLDSIKTPSLLITMKHEEKFLAIREAGRSLRYGRYVILPEITYLDGLPKGDQILPEFFEFLRRQRWNR